MPTRAMVTLSPAMNFSCRQIAGYQNVSRAPTCKVLAVAAVSFPNEPELILVVSPPRFVWLNALRRFRPSILR